MEHNHKPFDADLKERYGDPAETWVETCLVDALGRENVIRQPDGLYGVDLAWLQYGRWFCGDVERRENWSLGAAGFPYETCHMPLRKGKFLGNGRYYWYIAVSDDLRAMLWFDEDTILAAPLAQLQKSKLNDKPEVYVNISVSEGIYYTLA